MGRSLLGAASRDEARGHLEPAEEQEPWSWRSHEIRPPLSPSALRMSCSANDNRGRGAHLEVVEQPWLPASPRADARHKTQTDRFRLPSQTARRLEELGVAPADVLRLAGLPSGPSPAGQARGHDRRTLRPVSRPGEYGGAFPRAEARYRGTHRALRRGHAWRRCRTGSSRTAGASTARTRQGSDETRTRKLGTIGPEVSAIGFGCWSLTPDAEARRPQLPALGDEVAVRVAVGPKHLRDGVHPRASGYVEGESLLLVIAPGFLRRVPGRVELLPQHRVLGRLADDGAA